MAIDTVNTGNSPNDDTGDALRTAFDKINDNFTNPDNAASYLVGSSAGQIPRTDDLGDAAYRNLLGTVSQSGGTPTGAVIERGSNANGEYVKFADGTLICTKVVEVGAIDVTNAFGSVYITDLIPVGSYPHAFVSQPFNSVSVYVVGSGNAPVSFQVGNGNGRLDKFPIGWIVSATFASQRSYTLLAFAIGRWQ